MSDEKVLSGCPNEEELEKINKLSRKPLKADEVFSFSVILCDNEIDRDFERFDIDALKELAVLFVGKTGLLDHSMKAGDQSARIYDAQVCFDTERTTSYGDVYTYVKAKAYTVRTAGNADFIAEIDAGIKKEVSVGCRVEHITCSVCGADMSSHECEHLRGKRYGSSVCCGILSKPTDAYEWSFVAVPSQRGAGVTKAHKTNKEKKMDGLDIIKTMTEDTVISTDVAKAMADRIAELEALAADGIEYRNDLRKQIEKYALVAVPKLAGFDFVKLCDGLNTNQLCSLKDRLCAQANELLPVTTQLKAHSKPVSSGFTDFKI